ncbi:MAG TPA: class I SAM-dependent methyltransferase [Anaerolineales bacterium]
MRALLKFFFHHFYHTFAWTYDFVAALVSIGRWADWRRQALPYLTGNSVLEIGFGTGHLQVDLHKRGLHVFGLDESPQMAAIGRQRLLRQGFTPGLVRGRAQELPFIESSLDVVLATFPSEFIMDRRSLAEFHRVLRPSGRLLVVPAAWIGASSLPDRLASFLFRVTGQTPRSPQDLERRVMSLLSQAGFDVEITYTQLRASTVMVVIASSSGGDREN